MKIAHKDFNLSFCLLLPAKIRFETSQHGHGHFYQQFHLCVVKSSIWGKWRTCGLLVQRTLKCLSWLIVWGNHLLDDDGLERKERKKENVVQCFVKVGYYSPCFINNICFRLYDRMWSWLYWNGVSSALKKNSINTKYILKYVIFSFFFFFKNLKNVSTMERTCRSLEISMSKHGKRTSCREKRSTTSLVKPEAVAFSRTGCGSL